jgi:hypothetical protein
MRRRDEGRGTRNEGPEPRDVKEGRRERVEGLFIFSGPKSLGESVKRPTKLLSG